MFVNQYQLFMSDSMVISRLQPELVISSDPVLDSISKALNQKRKSVVTGSDPQVLLDLLISKVLDHAFNEESVVICIRDKALEEMLMRRLTVVGLQNLVYHSAEAQQLQHAMASLKVARKKPGNLQDNKRQKYLIEEYQAKAHNYARKYQCIDKKILGERTWKQIADRYTLHGEHRLRNLLIASLNPLDFEASQQEYWMLKGRVESFEQLQKLRTSAFEKLSGLNFAQLEKNGLENLSSEMPKILSAYIGKAEDLLVQYAEFIGRYRYHIKSSLVSRIRSIEKKIRIIQNAIKTNTRLFGEQFTVETSLSNLTNRLRKSFSKVSRELLDARSNLRQHYILLLQEIEAPELQALFQELELDDLLTVENIISNLQQVDGALKNWHSRLQELISSNCKRINSNNIEKDDPFYQRLLSVEKHFDDFVQEVNSNNSFEKRLEINALSLEKKSHVILEALKDYRRINDALSYIEEYVLWNAFWSHLPPKAQDLLSAIEPISPEKRLPAFEGWYQWLMLERHYSTEMIENQSDIQDFLKYHVNIVPLVPQVIKRTWQAKRYHALHQLRKSGRELSQAIARSRLAACHNALRQNPSLIAELFPIVLTRDTGTIESDLQFWLLVNTDEMAVPDVENGHVFMLEQKSGTRTLDFIDAGYYHHPLQSKHCPENFHWQKLSTANKLAAISGLASMFTPFAASLRIYNARSIQILSFLGAQFDQYILDQLSMPYKYNDADRQPTLEMIQETFLDTSKPIVVLTRDGKLGDRWKGNMPWHQASVSMMRNSGLYVLNVWTVAWQNGGLNELNILAEEIRRIAAPETEPSKLAIGNSA